MVKAVDLMDLMAAETVAGAVIIKKLKHKEVIMSNKTGGKYPVDLGDDNNSGSSNQSENSGSGESSNVRHTNENSHNQGGASKSDPQNASGSMGGTTDMDHRSYRGATGNTNNNSAGSGMASKTSVTGSDFDGQIVDQ
jgi:hypothetical protein